MRLTGGRTSRPADRRRRIADIDHGQTAIVGTHDVGIVTGDGDVLRHALSVAGANNLRVDRQAG